MHGRFLSITRVSPLQRFAPSIYLYTYVKEDKDHLEMRLWPANRRCAPAAGPAVSLPPRTDVRAFARLRVLVPYRSVGIRRFSASRHPSRTQQQPNSRPGRDLPVQRVVDWNALPLGLGEQPPPLVQLRAHELDGALQDQALGAALALEARDEVGQAIEALSDGLAALLFCKQGRRCEPMSRRARGRSRGRATYLTRCGSASSPPR